MDIIGLNGRKGVGKDTVGAYLVERYGFTRASFAGLLKESAAALFGFDPEVWEELKNDESATVSLGRSLDGGVTRIRFAGLTVRKFLQRYGTEAHRDIFDSEFWVDALFSKLKLEDKGPYVITDARFPNELREVQRWGGINIRIQRETGDETDTHASESDPPLELLHAIIDNAGTIEELYLSVDAVMEQVYAESRGY